VTTPAEGAGGSEKQERWSRRRPAQAAVVYGLAYLAASVVGGWVTGHLASEVALAVSITIVSGVVLLFAVLLVLSICRLRLGPVGEVAAIILTLVAFALVRPSVIAFAARWVGAGAAGLAIAKAVPVLPGQSLLGNVVLIVWAGFLGRLVSRIIREGKLLLPVTIVAALMDIFTVFWGVVAHVQEKAPEVAQAFSASAPVEVPEGVWAPILAAVGIGDFLFLAVFLAVTIRFGMRSVKTLWAAFAVMLVAPLAFTIIPSATGLPGLPFLAAAALWANRGLWEFTAEERKAMGLAAVIVAVLAVGLWFTLHR
jgi:hypothetical protein